MIRVEGQGFRSSSLAPKPKLRFESPETPKITEKIAEFRASRCRGFLAQIEFRPRSRVGNL